MRRLSVFTIITLLSVASAVAQEEFKFEVTTTVANQIFAIPVSGGSDGSGGKNYNWNINWGDGSTSTNISGTGSIASAGIKHTYTTAKTYQITITPAGSNDRWLAAFGFRNNTNGANVQTNKDLVTKVISPITPLMTRTQKEIDTNTISPPNSEWHCTFYSCTNLTMDTAFTFSNAWDSITTVGNAFAGTMFSGCSGAAFTMNDVFNLPQNITTVGNDFAVSMFTDCSGSAFKMNDVFNLPQNITTVGSYFAVYMFIDCYGDEFKMNDVFNLPQNITTVGSSFAYGMFYNCNGAAFKVNNVFKFPRLTQIEIDKSDVFFRTFYNLGTVSTHNRTAASILNGNPIPSNPSDNRQTFTNSNCFVDRAYIHTRWGGDGRDTNFTVTYNYNGATGGSTMANKLVIYNAAYGYLPSPTRELYTITYNYNGSTQPNGSDTYPEFAGWYLEATFENEITDTTIVTTFSDHTIHAKWAGALILPTPAANAGYGFAGWYSEASCVNFVGNAGESYIPTANDTLYAKWVLSFTINATSGPNGNITPSGAVSVNEGSSKTFNFTPDSGYEIDQVLIDDINYPSAVANKFYTFSNVTAGHTIEVRFKAVVGISTIINDELGITVYPNPTSGKLTIKNSSSTGSLPGDGTLSVVEVYDIVGQVVFTSQLSKLSPETTINISHLANGLYFLKVDNKMIKIIKN